MTEQNKSALAMAIIALVISLGVPVADRTFGDVLTNELKDYYRCDKTGVMTEFKGGVSGTAYSGYPFVGSTKGAVYCGTSLDKGKWVKLEAYAQSLGLDPYELLAAQTAPTEPTGPSGPSASWGKQWICGMEGCVAK